MLLPVKEWIKLFEKPSPGLMEAFTKIYGPDKAEIEKRRQLYLKALKMFGESYSYSSNVIISRAPGRVNLLGRHTDYMGGYVNPMATDTEIFAIVEARDDDWVHLRNIDPKYVPGKFRIRDELPERKIKDLDDWDRWTAERFRDRMRRGEVLTWHDYVKGLTIYFQEYFRKPDGSLDKRIKGMNILLGGDLPPRRGMSSSSALVIAVAVAMKELNDIEMPVGDFIERVGYSEWYVLTRGGSADHAAITLSKRGMISHIGSLPTRAEEVTYAPFPKGFSVVIVNSGIERPQDDETKNYLRVTAAEYRLSVLWIKSAFPEYADKIVWLRDINVRNLGVDLPRIYELIKSLPTKISRRKLEANISDKYSDELDAILSNHREPSGGYKLRQRALFGLAENERAVVFPEFLRRKDIKGILELIRRSHDGDRVAKFDEDGKRVEWDPGAFSTDDRLEKLISILRSEDSSPSEVEAAQLYWQPGGYERSIPQIDYLCDVIYHAMGEDAAAQIMGAGLGGDVEVLVRTEKIGDLKRVLIDKYFEKYGVEPSMTTVRPGQGACLFGIPPKGPSFKSSS
ncbi:hypothetical protein CW702_01910 [Candidatus Bathyarchaeota archaeon]|nr:MAG: hypothetical protein CW702_01910 [Candidatus Bathyarchaeota archaeon]